MPVRIMRRPGERGQTDRCSRGGSAGRHRSGSAVSYRPQQKHWAEQGERDSAPSLSRASSESSSVNSSARASPSSSITGSVISLSPKAGQEQARPEYGPRTRPPSIANGSADRARAGGAGAEGATPLRRRCGRDRRMEDWPRANLERHMTEPMIEAAIERTEDDVPAFTDELSDEALDREEPKACCSTRPCHF